MKNKKQKEPKICYYSDELNDDFANTNIKQKKVDQNFKYSKRNFVWNIFAWLIYYGIAMSCIYVYEKLFLRVKVVNKKAFKKLKHQKCFIYGNHTSFIDAYTPNLISFPTRNRILTSPDAVSIPCIKNLVQMLGAVPIPNNISGMKKFTEAVYDYHKKCNITIYPEAHIWPYNTGVRNFVDSSFGYPVSTGSPVIAFFVAYSEPKGAFARYRRANITIYISDPIYPDTTKPKKEAQKELRDKVFNFMKDCSEKYSTYKVIDYKHISEKPAQTEKTQK